MKKLIITTINYLTYANENMNMNKDFLLKSKLSVAGFCTTCITNEGERYVIINQF